MSESDGYESDSRHVGPFDATPLSARQYRDLLEDNRDLVLRVSDGTGDGTFRFWVERRQLYWRCLNWTARKPADEIDLAAALDGDSTTQLLTKEPREDDDV